MIPSSSFRAWGLRRQSPAYVFYDARKWVLFLLAPLLRSVLAPPSSPQEWVLAALSSLRDAGLAGLLTAWSVWRWSRCGYRFQKGVSVIQGPFIHRLIRIPDQAAASLEMVCSPLMWLLRCRKVQINTAGLRRRADATLYLQTEEARRLFPRPGKQTGRFSARPWPVAIMAASSSNAALGLLSLAPALKQVSRLLGRELPSEVITLAGRVVHLGLPPLLESAANLLVVGWCFAFLRHFFRYTGFRAFREGSRLHLVSGLLTRRDSFIDCRRITGLQLRQTLFMKLFRLYTASITAAGYGRERGTRPVVIPAARAKSLCAGLDALMSDYPVCSGGVRPAPRSLRRYIVPPLIFMSGSLPLFFLGTVWTVAGVLWLAGGLWWLLIRWLGFRRAAFGVSRDAVMLRYPRGLALYEVHIPREAADCLIVTRSPWQRRSGTCQVELLSFGEQRRRHRVRGLPYEPVAFLRDRLAGK